MTITPHSGSTSPECARGLVVRATLRRYDGRLYRYCSVRFIGQYLRQALRRRANVLPPVGISTSISQRHVFDGGSTVHMVAAGMIFYRCASPPPMDKNKPVVGGLQAPPIPYDDNLHYPGTFARS